MEVAKINKIMSVRAGRTEVKNCKRCSFIVNDRVDSYIAYS